MSTSNAHLQDSDGTAVKLLNEDERSTTEPRMIAETTSARLRATSVVVADPDDPVADEEVQQACCCVKWKYAWLLGCLGFISSVPVILTRPLLIQVQKDYFGSDKKAAMWSSIIQSVVALINLFMIVAYGRLLDSIGRKPFFIASAVASIICYTSLAVLPHVPIVFMLLQGASGLIQSSYSSAFIADVVPPEQRAYAFTIIGATSTMSMIVSLPIGIVQAPNMVYYITSIAASVASLVFIMFLIPESLPKHNRKPFELQGTFGNPLAGATILTKSKAMLLISITACVLATADVGTQDVYMYYLNQRVGFTKQDNAFFFVEMAFISLVGYFVITPVMLKYVSTITVLCMGMGGNAALLILVATIWARWGVFAFIAPMYGLLVMIGPILDTMIVNIGHERDVGKRVTAMTAVSDFCNAAGPLIFGILYGELPDSLIALPFFVFAGLIMCTVVMLWFRLGNAIRDDQTKVQEELRLEALERGETPPEEDASNPNSPAGAARALYAEEDVA